MGRAIIFIIFIVLIFLLFYTANNPDSKTTEIVKTTGNIAGEYTAKAVDYGKEIIDANTPNSGQDPNTNT